MVVYKFTLPLRVPSDLLLFFAFASGNSMDSKVIRSVPVLSPARSVSTDSTECSHVEMGEFPSSQDMATSRIISYEAFYYLP